MIRRVLAAALVVLATATFAAAQSWEASGLVGYTPSTALDRRARELNQLDINGGFTWGAQVGRFFSPHWGIEALWTQQSSALRIGTAAGEADLFTMNIGMLHGDVVYRLRAQDARLQPFAFGGLGVTMFRADDIESETKLSLGAGGGIRYFVTQTLGVRTHVRYKPTFLDDTSSGDFCVPFGFCQGTLQQFEFAAGAVVRF